MFTYRLFNDDILLFESPCEQRHEFASELGAHGSNRKEEVRALTALDMMPHTSLVHSTARHNTMYVRMVEEIGSPRMEDGGHTGCETLLSSKGINSAPSSFKHTVVELPLIGHRNGMQTRRHREYDMEVLDRLLVLALGTMSVTTAVIADMHIPALGTHLDVAAKCASPALSHVSKSSSDSRHDLMLRKELISMTSYNLTNVKFGPHRLGGKMVSIRRTCFIGSMSAT